MIFIKKVYPSSIFYSSTRFWGEEKKSCIVLVIENTKQKKKITYSKLIKIFLFGSTHSAYVEQPFSMPLALRCTMLDASWS